MKLRQKLLCSLLLAMLTTVGAVGCGYNNRGTVFLSWSLADARLDPATAPPLPCEAVGVTVVRLSLGAAGSFDFDCRLMQGETGVVPAGNYAMQAIAFRGTQVASAIQINEGVFGRTDLGHIIFQI